MKAKKILITGGAGFVGSHLADALLDQGHEVRVFDSLSPQVHGGGIPSYLSPHVELMRGDMRDASACGRAITGIEVIFHLAAAVGVGQSMYHIADYMGANTQGTAVLLPRLLGRQAAAEKLGGAASMSIFWAGGYLLGQFGGVAPAAGPPGTMVWEALV